MNDKDKAPDSQGKNQDNIGYENTEKRTDRDDKEMNRLQTTDTGKDEKKQADVNADGDEDDDEEEKVFGQL